MVLLDLTISSSLLTVIGIFVLIVIASWFEESKVKDRLKHELKELKLQIKADEANLKVHYQQWALDEFDKFKVNELDGIKRTIEANYREAAITLLQQWKIEEEARIRQDAINRSYSVNLGKITEHLVPFHANFLSQFNPKDARFIGSPIDLIVFDGYADKRDDFTIYFVEVKTGNSKLSKVQQNVKQAILNGQIRWAEINPDSAPLLTIK